ncbi:hypothetical protein [Sphingomonas sp. SFZ2018-12]|uniref:hypothetical protein n=1 Tax=Sphingomonas sp. SFZ2018-12 TaxID=2683197 RepID=UPI001F103F02|nr:hypothetical protein [Sphingomonas sp. SFZ2018-12]
MRTGDARLLEQLASDLHMLAFDMAEPSRTVQRAERLIAEGERIAAQIRQIVRGRRVQ